MVKFIGMPKIKGVSEEIRAQFIGLEVSLNELESIGYLAADEDSELALFRWEEAFAGMVAIEMSELVLSAFKRKRYELGHYLMNQQSVRKIVVPVTMVKIF